MIRRLAPNPAFRDPNVGCTVLAEPFFWPEPAWIPDPPGWARSIMRGRYYDTRQLDGAELWGNVQARIADTTEFAPTPSFEEPKNPYGEPMLVEPRLGQGAFRVLVTDAYKRRCAITGENTLPVLEAAHILPFAESGPNRVSNGLLLRSDFHKLLLSKSTMDALLEFRRAGDWEKFHTPRNLAAAISVEAGELLEIFVWASDDQVRAIADDHRAAIKDEMADIAILLTYLAYDLSIDIESAVQAKISDNAKKYPVERARGSNKKYSEL